MSEAEMIREGQINKKKLVRQQCVISARVALRGLINAASYAQDKKVEDIDAGALRVHLETLVHHQELVKQLDEEIRELEY